MITVIDLRGTRHYPGVTLKISEIPDLPIRWSRILDFGLETILTNYLMFASRHGPIGPDQVERAIAKAFDDKGLNVAWTVQHHTSAL